MLDRAKYIILDRNTPIIFAPELTHVEVASTFGLGRVKSAGFLQVSDDSVCCFGESVSLGIRSSISDAKWIGKLLGIPN